MKTLLAIILLALSLSSFARDPSQVRAFRKLNACPATKLYTGACPGYVVDHIIPLCAGGPDAPRNMQWQTRAKSLIKDRLEWETCRNLRKTCPRP